MKGLNTVMANLNEGMGASSVSFDQALLTLGVFEVETVARSQSEDPNAENQEKMAMTKIAIDSIEAFVAALFGISIDEVREGLSSIPASEIERAIKTRIIHALSTETR